MDIVFFHGLQPTGDYRHAWREAWQQGGSSACCPDTLLSHDFPAARIMSVCYDSAAWEARDQGRMDLVDIGREVANNLVVVGAGKRPLVLVAHSLGGLVVKQVCLELADRAASSLDPAVNRRAADALGAVKGMAFYSTPHAGSQLASNAVVKAVATGKVMQNLQIHNEATGELNWRFHELRTKEGWIRLSLYETQATGWVRRQACLCKLVYAPAGAGAAQPFHALPPPPHICILCRLGTDPSAACRLYIESGFHD